MRSVSMLLMIDLIVSGGFEVPIRRYHAARHVLDAQVAAFLRPSRTARKLPTNLLWHRRSGRLRLVYGLDAIENLAEIALRDLNVIVVLQIEPKLCRGAECLGEPKRSIGGNAGLFAGDPLDPCARQAAGLGKSAR